MQFPKLLSFSNALNGMKRRQAGYNLETTGMLPNFGKPGAPAVTSQTSSVSSAVLDPVSSWLKKFAAAAKRVLLKPEEPQPFGGSAEKKSYQVFRRLPEQDAVRHVATVQAGEPTAEVFTDNQELGKRVQPTVLEKLTNTFRREMPHSSEAVSVQSSAPATDAPQHLQQRANFGATCPGKPEANPIADAYEKRMTERKASAPVVVKPATPVLHSAAKSEVNQSVPSKLREAIFGRKRNAAQPAVQGEFALDNVRPIRNELLDADLEVVSAEAKVGTGKLQTATAEKAITTTATSRRGITKKTDSAINSAADAPQTEPTPELIARV